MGSYVDLPSRAERHFVLNSTYGLSGCKWPEDPNNRQLRTGLEVLPRPPKKMYLFGCEGFDREYLFVHTGRRDMPSEVHHDDYHSSFWDDV